VSQRTVLQYCRIRSFELNSRIVPVTLLFCLSAFCFTVIPQHCNTAFFERRAEGWHWYQDLSRENEVQKPETREQKKEEQTPTQMIESQRKELETKLHAAVVEPTQENLIAYILAQKALMDQSQRFSESWQRVVMTTPALDETLIHPVDQNARHVYYGEKNKELTGRIKALAQELWVIFLL
jgi:conjugal transfer pilus assembly protein TraF